MISVVAKVINLCASTIQNALWVTSAVGELITAAVLCVLTIISDLSASLLKFFQIVYEDNASIFTEVPETVKSGVENVTDQLSYLHTIAAEIYSRCSMKLAAVISSLFWMFNSVYVIVSEIVIIIFNAFILIGESVWLIVTFLPIHVPLLLRSTFKYVSDCVCEVIVNSYMKLLKFTNYLTEVPLESFMGIISAIVIIRLCIHFNETIVRKLTNSYWCLVRNVCYLYHMIFNYFTNTDVHTITRLASSDILHAGDGVEDAIDSDEVNPADSLCVICQERQKSVLTLPCRHMCLCAECCRRLYSYQRTCPICRTFIYHSVTVYW